VTLEEKKARYRVISTVFLKMLSNNPVYGNLEIAGNITRSVSLINYLNNSNRKRKLIILMPRAETISILKISEN